MRHFIQISLTFLFLLILSATTIYAQTAKPKPMWQNRTVYIKSVDNGMFLDADTRENYNGSRVYMWTCNRTKQQQWELVQIGANRYYIRSVYHDRYLDADPDENKNGSRVYLWDKNKSSQQTWTLKCVGGNIFHIESVRHGRVLDADPRETGNGSRIYLWDLNGQDQQKWEITNVR